MNCSNLTIISSFSDSQRTGDINEDAIVTALMESGSFPSISPNEVPLGLRLETSQPLQEDQQEFSPGPHLYVNTCDKVSMLEICHDVRSLNSSIGDIVDAMIEENFQRRGINMREGVNVWQQSDLVKVAWQHRWAKDKRQRRSIFDAILHDLVTDFVNKVLEDEPDSISQEYKHFRRTSAKVMTVGTVIPNSSHRQCVMHVFTGKP